MLKLGVIGLSEGNGHPFSWSAIINGDYDTRAMEDCGYAVIPVYLAANRDTLGIEDARVTHVWTQDRKISADLVKAAKLEASVDNIEDLIGKVDAVLLARDDPANHVAMAKPFLEAGVPIFIDKPLAYSREDLNYFIDQAQAGKFFMSCSSMRYAAENGTMKLDLPSLGQLELATAVGKKDWPKYGVHMLEGLFSLLDDPRPVAVKHISKTNKDIVYVEFETGLIATLHLFYDIVLTFQISVFGQNGWRQLEYRNWFVMFRNNLNEFVRSVREGKSRLSFDKTVNIINTLVAGKESLEQGGKTITLT